MKYNGYNPVFRETFKTVGRLVTPNELLNYNLKSCRNYHFQ